jgi:hypothetical protein
MCRIEESVEFSPEGRPLTSSRIRLCDKARNKRPCRDATVIPPPRYNPKRGSLSRDDTPSPVNPPTPTNTGTYLVQTRRPSGSGSRPSTRDGQRPINNEIIIQIGSKKDKGKKYPRISVSSKPYDRSSIGSVGSHDVAVDSVGSDASYTYRTGFPEAPLPPPATFDQHTSYLTTPTVPYGHNSRLTPSASSSQTPSLYVASDVEYDPPSTQRSTRRSATVIHNPPALTPSSPQRQGGTLSGSYRTAKVAPRETYTVDHPHPLDYDAFADHSNSSYDSSGVPQVARRVRGGEERQRQTKPGRHQEESERRAAEERDKAESDRHVHFELGRAESRAKERAERHIAEKDKDRALAREEARRAKEEERLRQEKKELEEKRSHDRKKEKSSPPAVDYTKKRPSGTRRLSSSMTTAQLADQQRLIEAEKQQMRSERQIAEAREREEDLAARKIQQQEKQPGYWDPRGGDRSLSTRRGSMTRHDSVASNMRPVGLTRTPSKRRTSVSQPNPPTLDTQVSPESYRPSSSRKRAPPPLSFPANFNQDYARPPSARRPSFGQENPFAASSMMSPSSASQDPWDLRNVESTLPSSRPLGDGRYPVMQPHGYADTFATDSESPDDHAPVYASRTGLSRKGSKRKH